MNRSWIIEPIRFVENILGDLIFIAADAVFNLIDRTGAWDWDKEKGN